MTIQLACCSDTHDGLPPAVELTGMAAWLHAGDVYEGPDHALSAGAREDDWLRREDFKKGEPLRQWTAEQAVPVYTVRGNHDGSDYWKIFDSWQDVGGRVVQLADHLFAAGLGWCGDRYSDTPGESDLEPICQMLIRQAMRRVTPNDSLVLLTHYPALLPGLFPLPGRTEGVAFECIRRLIEQLAPIAVVQGHAHDWFGLSGYFSHTAGTTLVLNPGPRGAVLSVDTANARTACRSD
jgi:Icc-related predicted phosphoesterase